MLCEKCKKQEATLFYEENINGKVRSYSLCPECAAELEKKGELAIQHDLGAGLFSLPSYGITDGIFGSLFGLPEGLRAAQKSCPLCHAVLDDFRREGKTGCPLCYETFAAELGSTIRSIHGNVRHIGRAPSQYRKQNEKKNRLEQLKKDLKVAIAAENFEEAAKLRDAIRATETDKEGM